MYETTNNQLYCRGAVKEGAPERFLVALFAAESDQRALFALLAFHIELAKTRELVSEAMLGEIRLQWWQEALDGIVEGKERAHPVVEELSVAIKTKDLSIDKLRALIEARRAELYDKAPDHIEDIVRHAEQTGGILHLLMLDIVMKDPSYEEQTATSKIGTAWSLIGIARAMALEIDNENVDTAVDALVRKAADLLDDVKGKHPKATKDLLALYHYYWLARAEIKSLSAKSRESLSKLRLMFILLFRSLFLSL